MFIEQSRFPPLSMSLGSQAIYVAAILTVWGAWRFLKNRGRLPLPPGPARLPLVGNLFNAPKKGLPWEAYHELSLRYNSEITSLDMAGTHIIILDSAEAMADLLERRGSNYSSRPPMPMLRDLMGWDLNMVLMPYGTTWRNQRRLMHQCFSELATQQYHSCMVKNVHKTLGKLHDKPEDYKEHLQTLLAAVIVKAVYGLEITSMRDPCLQKIERTAEMFTAVLTPGQEYLVDTFPLLKHIPSWFPGAKFKRDAANWKKEVYGIMDSLVDESLDHFRRMTALTPRKSDDKAPCLVSVGYADLGKNGEDRDLQYKCLRTQALTAYGAGLDTSMASISTFLLAMILHPEAQRKAQEELDSVLGHGVLPSFDDQASLPYVSALIKESTRWKVAVPTAIPHYSEAEDVYKGYRIPANSIVFGNAWAMLHDEIDYPEPHTFNPERFLTKEGRLDSDVRDPATLTFGFGRRICAGRHFATSILWMTAASILAMFDISPEVAEDGKEILPSVEYEPLMISPPKPFKFTLKPRSQGTEGVLLEMSKPVVGKKSN